jgi:hypothetical protein
VNLNMGEIVTVTKHDHEGRILEFVKTPIPLGTAEELKAAAALDNKRKHDKAVLRDTAALLATAKSLRLAKPRRVDDDKPASQDQSTGVSVTPVAPPPALPIKSKSQSALPAPVSDVSPQRSATRTVMPKRTIDDFIDEASIVLSAMKAVAERDGAQVGKSVMVKWLEPHRDCAAGSRLEINTVQIDNAARAVLDQLCKQKSFAVRMPEAHDSFLKAFRAGANAALTEFNARHAKAKEC